jgi:dimeric dUTPase (all-alpha-NTP-PPase superfamily)
MTQEEFEKSIDNGMGNLHEMFEKQKVLQKRLKGIDLPAMRPDQLPMTVTSIVAELGEILEEQQAWKDWKKNPKPVNHENLDTEIADVWHFVINLTLYLGYDAHDIYRVFNKKNDTNHERQDNNY